MDRMKSLSGLVATSRDWSLFVAPMITRLVPPPAGYPHRTLAVAAAAKGCRESPIQVPLAVGCRGDQRWRARRSWTPSRNSARALNRNWQTLRSAVRPRINCAGHSTRSCVSCELAGLSPGSVHLVGETTQSDLKTRPDFAATVNKALVGFIEVKAPGKGADPRLWR